MLEVLFSFGSFPLTPAPPLLQPPVHLPMVEPRQQRANHRQPYHPGQRLQYRHLAHQQNIRVDFRINASLSIPHMQFRQGFLRIDADLPEPFFLAGNIEPANLIIEFFRKLLVIVPVANAFRTGTIVIDRNFILLHNRLYLRHIESIPLCLFFAEKTNMLRVFCSYMS
jgi:hypothetical protein